MGKSGAMKHWHILNEIEAEYIEACVMYPPMRSLHEGYAILKEEVDELWDSIKYKKQNKSNIRREAIQVAAMALRLVVDCIDT